MIITNHSNNPAQTSQPSQESPLIYSPPATAAVFLGLGQSLAMWPSSPQL
jgi:hypothetical protein